MKRLLLVLIFCLTPGMASGEGLTYANIRERLEFFSQSKDPSGDFRSVLDVVGGQWKVSAEQGAFVSGFLARYFELHPQEYGEFEKRKPQFKSRQWVALVEEARSRRFDTIEQVLALNREYFYSPDLDWFYYFVDADQGVLNGMLTAYAAAAASDGYPGWGLGLLVQSDRHPEVGAALRKRTEPFFQTLLKTPRAELEKKTKEANIQRILKAQGN